MRRPAAIDLPPRPPRGSALVLGLVAVCLAGRHATAAPAEPPLAIAVVVGSNHAPAAPQQDLRFADDDAVQSARTLARLGIEPTLLVAPDAETRELYPTLHPAGPATRAAMRAAFHVAASRIAAARDAGRLTRLYFFFAGHGDLADGRPFLQLDDGRLWREDLAELLRAADADDNHVLVDACYASAFVAGRGPGGGERARLGPGFSRASDIWPARIGFLTARSAGEQTHEWAEFQAGIFSHELRSGLTGAADANVDGKVTYREIAAFVQRANEAVPNRRFRPQVSTIPPDGDLDTVLAELPDGPSTLTLELDARPAGRTFVESARGVRLCDVHPGAGAALRLRLPTDEGPLFVQQANDANPAAAAREYPLAPQPGHVALSTLPSAPPRVRARGAAHESFLLLFRRPFDAGVVAAFRLDADPDAPPPPSAAALRRRRIGKTAAGAGIMAVALGAGCAGAAALIKSADSPGNSQAATSSRNDWIRGLDVAGWTLVGIGGAAIATGVAMLLWPDGEAPVAVTASADGAMVGYRTRF